MAHEGLDLNTTRAFSVATGCLIVGASALTGKWAQIASLSSASSLTALALSHLHEHGMVPISKREDVCEVDCHSLRGTWLTGVLVGSMASALVPLGQAVVRGGVWQNRTFLIQMSLPALTLAVNAYTLWDRPSEDEDAIRADKECWMPVVERAACFLTSALATTSVAYFAATPSPVLAVLTVGSSAWFGYRNLEKGEVAGPATLGIALASALATAGMLGARFSEGALFLNKNQKWITLGQSALFVTALAVIADTTHTTLENR